MDANIDNGEENDDHQHLAAEQEQQQIADAADAAAAADDDERLLKLISVLERKSEFHLQSRTRIDILVEQFLDKTEDDIFKFLCGNNSSPNLEDYSGLDSDRDTEEEVETAIRSFPNVLSRRKEIVFDNIVGEWIDMEGRFYFYPVRKVTDAMLKLFPLSLSWLG
jgi:hypothetical protein